MRIRFPRRTMLPSTDLSLFRTFAKILRVLGSTPFTCFRLFHWPFEIRRITSCRVASCYVALIMSSLLSALGVACVMTKLTYCSADSAIRSHCGKLEGVLICNQLDLNPLLSTELRNQMTATSDASCQSLLKLGK